MGDGFLDKAKDLIQNNAGDLLKNSDEVKKTATEVGKKIAEKCKNLTLIECHAVLPPKLDGVSNNKVELRVPETSISAYRNAKNWKNFKNIQAIE